MGRHRPRSLAALIDCVCVWGGEGLGLLNKAIILREKYGPQKSMGHRKVLFHTQPCWATHLPSHTQPCWATHLPSHTTLLGNSSPLTHNLAGLLISPHTQPCWATHLPSHTHNLAGLLISPHTQPCWATHLPSHTTLLGYSSPLTHNLAGLLISPHTTLLG